MEEDRVEYEEVFLKEGPYFMAIYVGDSIFEEVISFLVEIIYVYVESPGDVVEDAGGNFVV